MMFMSVWWRILRESSSSDIEMAAALVPQFKRDTMAFVPKRLLYTDQIWFFIY